MIERSRSFRSRELLLTLNIPNQFAVTDHKGAVIEAGIFRRDVNRGATAASRFRAPGCLISLGIKTDYWPIVLVRASAGWAKLL